MNFHSTPSIRIRLSLVICVFALLSIGMLVRSTWLQIIHDPKLTSLAKRQFQSKILMKPRRGLIMDRTGEPLAINLETSSLAGSPQKILKSPATLHLLARALGTPASVLKKRLDPKRSFFWVERHLSDERLERLRKIGIIQANGDMPEGLWVIKEMKRVYPHGELASSLIGSVNVDTEGLEGVELWKNSLLRGKGASFDAFKDALGRPALITANEKMKMEDGENTELSIDASLQYSVEEALSESMDKTKADAGLVAVMDSNTGEILALAQSPSHVRHVKKVTAISDGYEPGSTMKPLMLAAAINKGVVKITDSLFGHYGKFILQGRTISEAEAHEKFGYITVKKMIEVSSNVVAAELALKLGADRYVAGLKELGFGARTGIGFPGEIAGWMPSQTKAIKPLTLGTMGFGQSVMVTPIQMLRAYAVLSNGGYLVEPTLLKRNDKDPVKRIPVLKAQAVRDVTDALIGVTESEKGTGHKAQVEGFHVAGKTGTAQTVDPHTHRYSNTRYIASFIGYPAKVKQPVTIITLLDHPRGIYYGGETAAPLFSRVLKQVVSRFSIPATEKVFNPLVEGNQTPHKDEKHDQEVIQIAKSSAEVAEASIESTQELNIDHPVMPSMAGLTPQEAIRALKPFTPIVQIKGFGLIKKQIPESGATISKNVRVTLFLEE
ncbi:MAG: PASTA domain-containing protein [Bdellovibrionales bacterium]|nr:PASTA domain-containing protein [Oligoflexia bacterium]